MIKEVFAMWIVPASAQIENMGELHICCGVDDEQWKAFEQGDDDASIVSMTRKGVRFITFSAPSRCIEKEADYWLSPCPIIHSGGESEAAEWGIRDVEQ